MDLEEFIKRIEMESCLLLPSDCPFPYPLEATYKNGTYRLSFQDDRQHLIPMPYMDLNALYPNTNKKNMLLPEDIRKQMKTAVWNYVKEYETACKKDCNYKEQFTVLSQEFPAEQIFYTLYPVPNGSDGEHLKELYNQYPCMIRNDIAFVYSVCLEQTRQHCRSSFIFHDLFDKWQISIRELHQAAMRNTPRLLPYRVKEIKAGHEITAYEITSQQHLFGLGTLFYEEGPLKEIAAEQNRNLFVLCLSVHEAIAIPDDGKIRKEELENLMQKVHPFSKEIYYYHKDAGELAMNALEMEELEARQKMSVIDTAEKNNRRRMEKGKWEKQL